MTTNILPLNRICTKCKYSRDISWFGKKAASKDGLRPDCKDCRKKERMHWRENNPNYHAEYFKTYIVNKIRISEHRKAHYKINRDRLIKKSLEYAKNNPERYAIRAMQRIAIKINATPKWADKNIIKSIYLKAELMKRELGIVFHVDHIIPLKSNLVCGLHVQTNLQILTAVENIEKSNRYWPDMP